MSDISVRYDLSYTPSPVTCKANMSIDGVNVNVSLADVPRVLFTATPHYSANILESVISTVGTPMANAITASLGLFATEILQGKTFNIYTVPDASVNVEGVNVNLAPSGLKMSKQGDMLMISGDFKLS